MALTLPKAFWPYLVQTGVNDRLDAMMLLTGANLVRFNAATAAATYYSLHYGASVPPQDTSLGHAIAVALQAGYAAGWSFHALSPQSPTTPARCRFASGSPYVVGLTSGYNLLQRSQTLELAPWSPSNITIGVNAIAAPDGTVTADKLQETAVNGQHVNTQGINLTAGTRYVHSIFTKAAERTFAELQLYSAADNSIAVWNLGTGALDSTGIGGTASGLVTGIRSLANGWYWIWLSHLVGTSGTFGAYHAVRLNGATQSYLGTAGSGAYFWQAQVEPSLNGVPGPSGVTTAAALTPAANPLMTSLGFTDNVIATLSGSYFAESQIAHANGWYADRPVADDTGDLPTYERAQALALGGQTYGLDFGTRYSRLVSLVGLNSYKTWKADEGTAHPNEALERLLDDGWQRLRWWKDAMVEGTYEDLTLDAGKMKTPPRNRLSPGKAMYSLALPFLKFVP